jgi:Zn-dependent protease
MRLFQFAGISVFVHWSWVLIAYYDYQMNFSGYTSPQWIFFETLAIFGIVLLHEFGHALACRSVGGKSDTIVLWPLGGVAYVAPPQRPGPELWSIAAGPLVNVALIPIFFGFVKIAGILGWATSTPNAFRFVYALNIMNVLMLGFNLFPIYPLDGGQILRSLLWFVLGRARSLFVASIIGFGGVALLIIGAFIRHSTWMGIMAAFVLMNCWGGLKYARALSKIGKLPKHSQFTCPSCKTSPPVAPLWMCNRCGARFDTFASNATCPGCSQSFDTTRCFECHESAPFSQWSTQPTAPPIMSL